LRIPVDEIELKSFRKLVRIQPFRRRLSLVHAGMIGVRPRKADRGKSDEPC
jgi:hypothetical protein